MATVQEKIDQLHEKLAKIEMGGGQKRIDSQHKKGKMTARERLAKLFDEGSFTEMGQFIHHRCMNFNMQEKEIPGDGVVTGYGTVRGRLVFAYAEDFTVEGGSLGEMHAHKIAQMQEMALKMGAPVIGINDSGGARIQEGLDGLEGYGKIFFRNTAASGVVPQITAIMGPCAGGAVYSPALTDFIFQVNKTGKMFITGPDVIKSVTGEQIDAEKLGGAMTHNRVSGVAHFMASDDTDCINQIRRLLSYLPSNFRDSAPTIFNGDDPNRIADQLDTIIPDNPNKAYDMYDVIKAITDGGEYMDYMGMYAPNMITCFARFNGRSVGIIANQPKAMAGCMDINCSDKAARFIRTCDAFGIPLLTLVDVPGFLPGSTQEHGGIIRHGAKVIYAYCEATVPKVTMILRKAYGGAYLAMCCKDLGSDIVYAWPTAEIAVMGAEGAANIIFRKATPEERAELIDEYKREFNNPYKAAERGMVDDVIIPSTSRQMIIAAMEMLDGKVVEAPRKKHGNVPL